MTATPDKNTQFLLLMLSSYAVDVVSVATLCMYNLGGSSFHLFFICNHFTKRPVPISIITADYDIISIT